MTIGMRGHDLSVSNIEELSALCGKMGVPTLQLALGKSYPGFRKGLFTPGQMKYYAETVENMTFEVAETGHYTIYVRNQDRTEFVTYIYVEG